MDITTLENEALGLTAQERGSLASKLLESLGYDGDFIEACEIDPALLDELKRRSDEWDENPDVGRPADEVLSDIRQKLVGR